MPPAVTVVCLHGWTLDHHSFSGQRLLVNAGVRLVRFDRRGFGRSGLAPNLESELDDLACLLDYLDTPVVLYGVSQGARLALRYAASQKHALAGLILQGGHVDGLSVVESPGEAIPFEMYRQWIARGDIERFREHWLQHPLVSTGMAQVPQNELMAWIKYYDGADLLAECSRPDHRDIRPLLSMLNLPVLTVVGSLETASRKAHAQALQTLLHAETAVISGGGHLCQLSHPEVVNHAISRWLGGLAIYPQLVFRGAMG